MLERDASGGGVMTTSAVSLTDSLTDSVNRLGSASQVTLSHGRTDGRTDGDAGHLPRDISPLVTPAKNDDQSEVFGPENAEVPMTPRQ